MSARDHEIVESELARVAMPAMEIRKGRIPGAGYARGRGIQFGSLRRLVRSDPVYRSAAALAEGRSVMAEDNRINLYLILRYYLSAIPAGAIVEFGAFRGGNAMFMARLLREIGSEARVYALDTFAGMPATGAAIDAHVGGQFSDVDLEEIRNVIREVGLDNLELVPGRFDQTAGPLLRSVGPVALAHIDADIYSAVAEAYETVQPFMVRGGYYVFDDATVSSCLGATEAVEELVIRRDGRHAEQVFPQFVFRSGL